MSYDRTSLLALCLSITSVLPCVAQNADGDSTWAAFLHALESATFPFHLPAPIDELSEYRLLSDALALHAFIAPHGLAHGTEVRTGHLLYSTDSFIAITAFIRLVEEKAWYLLTFTPDGSTISKGRLAAFTAHNNTRHEHWSTVYANGRMDHTALFRFFDEAGSELTCTQSQWQWQLSLEGSIDVVQPEMSEACNP